MSPDVRVGIMGGNGWLGNAIARAIVSGGVIAPTCLTLSGRSNPRAGMEIAGAQWTRDNQELVDCSDIVLLSVRPEQFSDVHVDAHGKPVISVMAGITAQTISERTRATEVVRAIPNAAVSLRRSFTPWYATETVTAGNKRLAQSLFSACGEIAEVPAEAHIDYCAGMTGSGAAFPALLAEALAAHAVEQGLPRHFAERAAQEVVAGASQLFAAEGDATAAGVVRTMIDYGGTTASALQAMLDHGFNEAVAAGLEAASKTAGAMSAPTDGRQPRGQ